MTPFERSGAFWLWASPRRWRWRELRACEVTAVLSDVVDRRASRPDASIALGLALAR